MNVAVEAGACARIAAGLWKLCVCGLLLFAQPAQAGAPALLRVALSDAGHPTSYAENGKPAGVLKEMLEALFSTVPGYRLEFRVVPWTRGQRAVEDGSMDMFITFPSAHRSQYAGFTAQAVFTLDYGNVVYDLKGRNAAVVESARSFEDLRKLVFIHQDGVEWELENVPEYIKRYTINGPNPLMHMTFKRHTGDFFIMNAEKAVYYARLLGYEKQLGMKRVSFIPNSLVGFHVGLRHSYPDSKAVLAALDAAMKQPEFLRRKRLIEQKYQERYALPKDAAYAR